MDNNVKNLYSKKSYDDGNPILIATLEQNERGQDVLKYV